MFRYRKIHFFRPFIKIFNTLLSRESLNEALLYYSMPSAILTKIDTIQYIPRGVSTKLQIFYFKKLLIGCYACPQKCCCLHWPGLLRCCMSKLQTFLSIFCAIVCFYF